MSPERKKKVNGHIIEEFYWAGKLVVYVNNKLYKGTFGDACREFEEVEHG